MGKIIALLFPSNYRYLPYNRVINLALRSAHILCFAVLTGGHFFAQPMLVLLPWLWATVLTGGLMMLIELYGSFMFLVELRGVSVLIKIVLLALIPWFWDERVVLLTVIIVLASVTSHMPGRFRHMTVISPRLAASLRGD